MADLKNYAIGTLSIALLVSLGFNVALDTTHFCRALELPKHCDRISGSGNRCYPYPGTTLGYKDCSSGWERLAAEISSDSGKVRINANAGVYNCPCGEITSYTKCIKQDGKEAYIGELI